MIKNKFINIFGIRFINNGYHQAKELIMNGGLMVVPAAPALVMIKNNQVYYNSLLKSDFAIPDSGYMVLILKLIKKIKIKKLSGVEFLRCFLKDNDFKNKKLFFVSSSISEQKHNMKYLASLGYRIDKNYFYIAPMYKNNIIDEVLVKNLKDKKPDYIIINIGGGKQEPLGLFVKNQLNYSPGIICTGAALSIISGYQSKMPQLIDRLYLGWFFRCLYNPKIFIPRYLKGFKLISMLIKEKIRR